MQRQEADIKMDEVRTQWPEEIGEDAGVGVGVGWSIAELYISF